jgi:hypothetical protein
MGTHRPAPAPRRPGRLATPGAPPPRAPRHPRRPATPGAPPPPAGARFCPRLAPDPGPTAKHGRKPARIGTRSPTVRPPPNRCREAETKTARSRPQGSATYTPLTGQAPPPPPTIARPPRSPTKPPPPPRSPNRLRHWRQPAQGTFLSTPRARPWTHREAWTKTGPHGHTDVHPSPPTDSSSRSRDENGRRHRASGRPNPDQGSGNQPPHVAKHRRVAHRCGDPQDAPAVGDEGIRLVVVTI